MTVTTFHICTKEDQPQIINFLEQVKDDFPDFNRQAIEQTTELLFQEGGTIAGYQQGELVGILGYLLGEPSQNYINKDVGYIFVTALLPAVRLTRLFREGLAFTMHTLQDLGIQQVRFHAAKTDRYTNRLYAHFAQCIGEEVNRRGIPCNLYAASIPDVLAYLDRRGRTEKQPTPDGYHRAKKGFRRTQGF
ncbi:MAG: hypothetical protein AAF629_04745 [Chloroflexota bacterium]